MPTNREVVEKGELIESHPCDWDPVNDCCESNGSIEAQYFYEGKPYWVFTNWDNTEAFLPNEPAAEGGF
jgi:hypothetical protein